MTNNSRGSVLFDAMISILIISLFSITIDGLFTRTNRISKDITKNYTEVFRIIEEFDNEIKNIIK